MTDITSIRRSNALALADQVGGTGAFAARIDREPTQVSRLIGSNPTKNIGNKLARHIEEMFGKPSGWLDLVHEGRNTTEHKAESNAQWIGPMDPWSDETTLEEDEVEVPLYKEVELAAGDGRTEVRAVPGRKLRFSYATLRAAGVDPAAAICAQLTGNSMEPLIMDGSTVGVDTGMTNVVDGEIYALEHGGMLRVKFLYRLPGGGLRLRSFNRDEYADEDYTVEEIAHQSVRVIGWVFWWSTIRNRRSLRLAR
ncbi:helix-turn-helix transcriptional regulator [Pseudomonas nitroreducens]|uniref:S24 family peptidase n=1 Tax=Pseudomonas nitroreducens TaxID=46680 RepID=UPI0023F7EF8C|nr:helix-turn-helix transcriptional regulator [Pseudomonas nitroreducens]WEW97725.1 helix-turn-helix transcriptional regulator [Pseudomonas nitroreducens]